MSADSCPFYDLAVLDLWKKGRKSSILRSRKANHDAFKLESLKYNSFIRIQDNQELSTFSQYFPELVVRHRDNLRKCLKVFVVPHSEDDYRCIEGVGHSMDLTIMEGPWKKPLPSFKNLIVLDIDLRSATYWLFPILSSAKRNKTFRRIIIRKLEITNGQVGTVPWPFPWRDLDLEVAKLKQVYLILVCPSTVVKNLMKTLLPLTEVSGRLCCMQAEDENAPFDPSFDPVGTNSMFHRISTEKHRKGKEAVQIIPAKRARN